MTESEMEEFHSLGNLASKYQSRLMQLLEAVRRYHFERDNERTDVAMLRHARKELLETYKRFEGDLNG